MACNGPLAAWKRRPSGGLAGGVTFLRSEAFVDLPVTLPCGKCMGCRMERAAVWAARIMHEAQLYPHNSFITLTYAPEHLPTYNGVPTLRPRDFQLFMKRLRKSREGSRSFDAKVQDVVRVAVHGEVPHGVRFFQAGEYGDRFGRPHHHAILFNCDFPDRTFWKKTPSGASLYRSADLERLWTFGWSSVGEVTLASAGYVARYTLKKSGAPQGALNRVPEYVTMSRGGRCGRGLAFGWFQKYAGDVFPADRVVLPKGRAMAAPRYYRQLLEERDPQLAELLKARRAMEALSRLDDEPVSGTRVEEVQRRRARDFLKRSIPR